MAHINSTETTLTFTPAEEEFMEKGGELWAIEQVEVGGWRLLRVGKSEVFVPDTPLHPQEWAAMLVRNFASLSENQHLIGVHHAVPKTPSDKVGVWPFMQP